MYAAADVLHLLLELDKKVSKRKARECSECNT